MCIGIPMQVQVVDGVFAEVLGRGQSRRVKTLLVGRVRMGDWVLVHLNDAREKISAKRAQEVNATLDMLDTVMQGRQDSVQDFDAFALPSKMAPQLLHQWSGAAVFSEQDKTKGDSV